MNDDTTINRVSIKHAYQQVADAIAARIAANQYPCKLPRELHLAEEFGISYVTVRHAMAILRERGLIVSIHGRGTFIASESAGNKSEDVEPLYQLTEAHVKQGISMSRSNISAAAP